MMGNRSGMLQKPKYGAFGTEWKRQMPAEASSLGFSQEYPKSAENKWPIMTGQHWSGEEQFGNEV